MRLLFSLFGILLSAQVLAAPSMSDVLAYSNGNPSADEAKLAVVRSTGLRIGAQAGMIERANAIVDSLNARAADLDRIFAFQPLIDEDGLLPPVIAESDQKVETKGGAQRIEFAGKTYRIIFPARFVRVAPTWRDYLLNGLATDKLTVDALPESLKPDTSEEKSSWDKSVREGWQIGYDQADAILAENTARLRRDYVGMLKYGGLQRRGMIRKPVLAETPESIKVTDEEIAFGVGVKEIQIKARMESDQGAWEANN